MTSLGVPNEGLARGFKEIYLPVKKKNYIHTRIFYYSIFSRVQATWGKVMFVGWLVGWSVRPSACKAHVFKSIKH